ncbi:MAG: HPr family phosphocarrier protein [Acutalibacteraceae bacterium]
MYSKTLAIPDLETAKKFVNITNKFRDATMKITSGYYVIDPRSIMGVLSLDLNKPIHFEACDNVPHELIEEISQFEIRAN